MSNIFCNARSIVSGFAFCIVVGSTALAQGTDEQTAACSGDAFTLCRGDIPNVEKITACMKAHEAQLSPRCRALFHTATAPQQTPQKQAIKAPARRAPEPKSTVIVTRVPKVSPEHRAKIVERVEPHSRRNVAQDAASHRPAPAPAVKRAAVAATAPTLAVEQANVAPVLPVPERTPGLAAYRANIVASCRKGLIDPYTCRSTLDALALIE